ncbi:MAG: Glycoside hydrolase [Lachnoclostridium sp.]|jgi:alpha-glucosidase (family GH31 glycosyl hydrolase)
MHKFKLDILEDEFWWGGMVQDGIHMPYKGNNFIRNLSKEQKNNQSAPLLLSSKGRYIWSEKPFTYCFDSNELIVYYETDHINYDEGYENLRGAYLAASQRYFPPTGKYPDDIMFQVPQYNTWIEMMYEPTQDKVISYAKDIIKNGFPAGVLIIDDNWQEDYGVWDFHPGRFPDPKSMVKTLHDMGFKVMLWVCNFISPDSLTFRELRDLGYLVRETDGKPALTEWWNGYSALLDVTNEDAVKWFDKKLETLKEKFNIDGFKFDAGDIEYFKENYLCSRPCTGNEYSEKWAEIGLKYSFNEYRACWKMGGQPLVQRLSDKTHSWKIDTGLGSLIPNGIAQGLLGFSFTCPDMIGGGEYQSFLEHSQELDQELIVRSAQCSALFPMMQFSVAPWRVLSKENLSYCVAAARLHEELGEEILNLVKAAAINGEPVIRHMEYVFPGNHYENINDQFMLGDNILVAPVLQKGATEREIIFPPGVWEDTNGACIQGPGTYLIPAPINKLPWYRKKTDKRR